MEFEASRNATVHRGIFQTECPLGFSNCTRKHLLKIENLLGYKEWLVPVLAFASQFNEVVSSPKDEFLLIANPIQKCPIRLRKSYLRFEGFLNVREAGFFLMVGRM